MEDDLRACREARIELVDSLARAYVQITTLNREVADLKHDLGICAEQVDNCHHYEDYHG